jgi:predicted TIM-barrel fold metal-dependent hydrolase
MQTSEMILVSCDDHVVEPRDMFDRHVPARWKDQAPRSIINAEGLETWVFQGVASTSSGLNAVVGWPKDEWNLDPTCYAEMRPGAYDIHERVRDMNHNGILGSMCFPSFAGFNARFFNEAEDKDLALIMLKAYNDWHIDEWCTTYPGRFIPLAIGPVWDPEALAAEVRRVAAKGCRAVTMPELPFVQGLPSYHDTEYWGPFFDACCDEGVVMCLHIGQGFGAIKQSPLAPIDNMIIISNQISAIAAQDMLWGPAFRQWPELKVAWSEGGIGWIAFYLHRCDRHYTNQTWLRNDFGDKLPSDVFREHSLACYIADPTSLKVREDIGMDIIAWECDYPHADAVWPNAPEQLMADFVAADVPDADIDKITWQNTCRFFGFDPFVNRPKDQATVGALRALSPDVDVTVHSRHEWRRRYEATGARS